MLSRLSGLFTATPTANPVDQPTPPSSTSINHTPTEPAEQAIAQQSPPHSKAPPSPPPFLDPQADMAPASISTTLLPAQANPASAPAAVANGATSSTRAVEADEMDVDQLDDDRDVQPIEKKYGKGKAKAKAKVSTGENKVSGFYNSSSAPAKPNGTSESLAKQESSQSGAVLSSPLKPDAGQNGEGDQLDGKDQDEMEVDEGGIADEDDLPKSRADRASTSGVKSNDKVPATTKRSTTRKQSLTFSSDSSEGAQPQPPSRRDGQKKRRLGSLSSASARPLADSAKKRKRRPFDSDEEDEDFGVAEAKQSGKESEESVTSSPRARRRTRASRSSMTLQKPKPTEEQEKPKARRPPTRASLAGESASSSGQGAQAGPSRPLRARASGASQADKASGDGSSSEQKVDDKGTARKKRSLRSNGGRAKKQAYRRQESPAMSSQDEEELEEAAAEPSTSTSHARSRSVPSRRSPSPSDPESPTDDGDDNDGVGTSSGESDNSSTAGLTDKAREKMYAQMEVKDKVVKLLDKGDATGQSKGYKKMSFQDAGQDVPPLRAGDPIDIKTSIKGKGGWMMVVEQFRALNSDIATPPPPPLGGDYKTTAAKATANTLYVKGTWLYTQQDLRERTDVNGCEAWIDPSYPMGPNERVKTDHVEWSVYIFDDSYPAPPPNSSRGVRSPHPLAPFRTSTLSRLQPSPYAGLALQTPSMSASSSKTPQPPMPDYFFAVGAERGQEGRVKETLEPATKGRRGDSRPRQDGADGRRGTAYVRVAFSFKEQGVVPALKEEAVKDEDEEGVKKRGKGGKKKKGKGGQRIQDLTWYSVADLEKGKHYSNIPATALGSITKKDVKGKGKGKGKTKDDPAFEVVIPVRTPSTSAPASASKNKGKGKSKDIAGDSRESSVSLGAFFPPSSAAPPSSSSTPQSKEGLVSDSLTLKEKLATLANSPIVRGGAYGLTGNAYLVTRASELLGVVSPSPTAAGASASRSNLTAAQRSNAFAEARQLLLNARAWEKGVRERVEGRGEGKGLRKEWRATGEAPKGKRWICPKSKEGI
ncbi:hypothetical protein JCM11641_006593 [Rhodosporidiobolus odoratus]